MAKLTHYVIHCMATPEGMEVTSNQLKQWHLGPAKLADGSLKYMGKVYKTTGELPKDKIGGIEISKLIGGRGWRQVGYSDMIHLDGRIENVVPYNEDANVDPWEITNGILASDSVYLNARHIVYAGGMTADNKKHKDTRTPAQLNSMINKVKETIARHPDIKVIGHNQIIGDRACPSFNVPVWLRSIGIQEKNIAQEPVLFKL